MSKTRSDIRKGSRRSMKKMFANRNLPRSVRPLPAPEGARGPRLDGINHDGWYADPPGGDAVRIFVERAMEKRDDYLVVPCFISRATSEQGGQLERTVSMACCS